MARARISDDAGTVAVQAARAGEVDRNTLATAVRYSLQLLAEKAPGNTLEVRVPPFAAVQCVEGPRHTRGTPPNVIETDAATWLDLAAGTITWAEARASGRASASGQRAELGDLLPVV
ncbi:sterol carrier family protein [Agromyces atrinae]|jgi:hypothetical protein|uniref:Bacterial SCP orthologue domain-containing protein n=1 Tax=Agromyces atrinae TaxID=592376 RepID=A0A4Q2M658_9MICO|nr:sterol carrier family protein [Agromyces atrinae]MCI2956394.1 sterol carrier family protein [Agromyces atrinae]NYD68229.1 hypothetical protein [Agromyces atrinae]RXZ87635.1 hypothetical protein ESP50_00040 [Agromyces atrinae]